MSIYSRPAQFYIWTIAVVAGACLIVAIVALPRSGVPLVDIAIFSALSALTGLFPVAMPRRRIEFSPTTAINIAAALLFPFSLAVLIPAIGALTTEYQQRRPWYKAMFNIGHTIVTYAGIRTTVDLLYSSRNLLDPSWLDVPAFLVVGAVSYVLDVSLIIIVVSLTGGPPIWYIWRSNYRSIAWHHVSMICAGFLLAILWRVQPWSIALIILPLAMLRQAFQLMSVIETQTHEAIEALVDTIDARDASTYQHSERVANYAYQIALAMNLEPGEVDRIRISARLHDLGKVGISDAWLYKPGPLTPEERAEFQKHSALGAQIVERFPILGVERRIVRSHHERWDGYGYPDGLRGEQIPLGSRIIAVADAFDAMTSDRPYRKGLSYSEARRRLHEGAGSQFDPVVVAAALDVLPREPEPVPVSENRQSEQVLETKNDPPPVVIPLSEQIA